MQFLTLGPKIFSPLFPLKPVHEWSTFMFVCTSNSRSKFRLQIACTLTKLVRQDNAKNATKLKIVRSDLLNEMRKRQPRRTESAAKLLVVWNFGRASAVCRKWKQGMQEALAYREKLSFSGWRTDDCTVGQLVEGATNLLELDM